jgi:hypothetical protein
MPETKPQKPLEIKLVPVKDLLLDPENPRLESIPRITDQVELVKAMWREMAVSEVAQSIAENGFFEEEPLFVVPAEQGELGPPFFVVEGNRRLTAVKLLSDDGLRAKVRATDLPSIGPERRKDLENLPVSVYPNREALWAYFGFRHVNGPKEWDSLSKAAYIARVRRQYGKTLDEITRRIGDQHSTVKRIYRGYVLLEQAERMTHFNREDVSRNRFYFSHLYTAADYEEVQAFLGTNPEGSLCENPIPKKHIPNLEQLMLWLFGSRERGLEPVVQTQAPDLSYLRSVIGNKPALAALRSGISLSRAYAISLGDTRRFEEALAQAKDALQEAKGTVSTGYKGNRELLGQMDSIVKLTNSLHEEMQRIAREGK